MNVQKTPTNGNWKDERARTIAEGETCGGSNWCVEDILSRFDVTEIDAAHFLVEIERRLAEAMTEAGWEFIHFEAASRGLTQKPEENWE